MCPVVECLVYRVHFGQQLLLFFEADGSALLLLPAEGHEFVGEFCRLAFWHAHAVVHLVGHESGCVVHRMGASEVAPDDEQDFPVLEAVLIEVAVYSDFAHEHEIAVVGGSQFFSACSFLSSGSSTSAGFMAESLMTFESPYHSLRSSTTAVMRAVTSALVAR